MRRRLNTVDLIVLGYTVAVGLFVLALRGSVSDPNSILLLHGFVLIALPLLPPRGAPWETPLPEVRLRRRVRETFRFLRHTYLLFFVLFYFEEVEQTVNALWQDSPYWFEPYLYAADRFLFGALPAQWMNGYSGFVLDEIMHFFYFSYFVIFIGGVVIAWFRRTDFEATLTSVMTAFLMCFSLYPFLPARGPWENPELMASMVPFDGVLFVPLIEAFIEAGAQSGGCFPSSHVAGSWAAVFGMWPSNRAWSLRLGALAVGMSLSCVYTRYHHFVDIPAGFLVGLFAAIVGHALVKRDSS